MNNQLTIAIPKGRILTESIELFAKIGLHLESMLEDSRKLIFEYPEQNLRALIVRATDVPTYVEYGCADLGIVGKAEGQTVFIEQKNKFVVGETIEIMKPDGTNVPAKVLSITDEETGEAMESAPHPQQRLKVVLDQPAAVYDLLRKKAPEA